jgi:hypothetical protein
MHRVHISFGIDFGDNICFRCGWCLMVKIGMVTLQ